jgi:hypothetical protein
MIGTVDSFDSVPVSSNSNLGNNPIYSGNNPQAYLMSDFREESDYLRSLHRTDDQIRLDFLIDSFKAFRQYFVVLKANKISNLILELSFVPNGLKKSHFVTIIHDKIEEVFSRKTIIELRFDKSNPSYSASAGQILNHLRNGEKLYFFRKDSVNHEYDRYCEGSQYSIIKTPYRSGQLDYGGGPTIEFPIDNVYRAASFDSFIQRKSDLDPPIYDTFGSTKKYDVPLKFPEIHTSEIYLLPTIFSKSNIAVELKIHMMNQDLNVSFIDSRPKKWYRNLSTSVDNHVIKICRPILEIGIPL